MGTRQSIARSRPPPRRDELRITVLGNLNGGYYPPDFLVNKFVEDRFEEIWTGNLKIVCHEKSVSIDDITVKLVLFYDHLWFPSLLHRFVICNGGLMILYDVHRAESFESAKETVQRIDEVLKLIDHEWSITVCSVLR